MQEQTEQSVSTESHGTLKRKLKDFHSETPVKSSRRRRPFWIILGFVCLPVLLCPYTWAVGFALYFEFVPQWRIQQSLKVYPDAVLLHEDSPDGIRGSAHIYYLASDPLEVIETYYESFRPAFLTVTIDDNVWLETAYKVSDGQWVDCNFDRAYGSASFPVDQRWYDCVNITMINTNTPYAYIPPVRTEQYEQFYLPVELQDLPIDHTLIIYTYYYETL